jgi:nucleotide-binding universal stress UspA family protein
MEPYRTILVAVALDGRDGPTLRHAARMASAGDTQRVYLVHVAPSIDLPADVAQRYPDLARPVDEDIRDRLGQLVDIHRAAFPADAQIECATCEGSPVPVLVRLASQKSADLVCIGARHHDDHPVHVAAGTIVRKAPCSVLVAHEGFEPRYERILAALDFSDCSRMALDHAIALARREPGGSLVLFHTYDVPVGATKTGQSHEEIAEVMRQVAEREWADFSQSVDFQGVPWQMRYELSPRTAAAIVAAADDIDACLIVLASHGRTRPASLLLGHVADRVLTRSTRPTLCVKKKGDVVNLLRALRQLYDLE